jgi:hypothetical protein
MGWDITMLGDHSMLTGKLVGNLNPPLSTPLLITFISLVIITNQQLLAVSIDGMTIYIFAVSAVVSVR